MIIEERALEHWIGHFYGYGSWHAKIWFVGYEEGGGDLPEDVADKLNYFYGLHTSHPASNLCDIRELYRHLSFRSEKPRTVLFKDHFEYRFGEHAIQHGIWKNLIAFVHGYRNEQLPDLLAYQKDLFALPSRQTEALINLYPMPSPHNHAWYYSWLDLSPQFSFLKSRTVYLEYLYRQRVDTILSNMRTYAPEVVVMYGMDNINNLKKSVQALFPKAQFKMVKATKQEIPQHHRADLGGTTILITTQVPALKHNRIETGFDWEAFGKRVIGG